jgi:RNA polymerase sigma factor (sigma-70 family)
MQAMDDMVLLREYATRHSEAAFEELVGRRIGFVYSAALRQVREPHLAEEVAQAVFAILAQKAGKISDKTVLTGWLFKTTRFAVLAQIRAATRRRRHEQEVQMQTELHVTASDPLWEQMSPLLDEALAALGEKDRQAVLLRYFENKSLAEVGSSLGMVEDTARKRISRALKKLHRYFKQCGISSTAAIIAGEISANSVQAAPAAFAKTVCAVALVKGATASISTLTLIKGALKIMAWTKAKTAIAVSVGALLAAGTVTVTVERIADVQRKNEMRRIINPINSQTEAAIAQIEAKLKTAYEPLPRIMIAPTKFPGRDMAFAENGNHLLGYNQPVKTIVELVFSLRWNMETRAILETNDWPQGRYDFNSDLPAGSAQALEQESKKTLGIVGIQEKRETDVLLLELKKLNAPGLKPPTHPPHLPSMPEMPGQYILPDQTISTTLVMLLESYFILPVIDQTGLTNRYDINLTWNQSDYKRSNPDGLKQALLDQLGLELVLTNMPIEMLVVEKVN